MTKPTLPEMSRKVYEAIEGHIEGIEYTGEDAKEYGFDTRYIQEKVIRLGDVLQYLENTIDEMEGGMYRYSDEVIKNRPKDHLSQPIPLEPDESWRKLLEFLLGLI